MRTEPIDLGTQDCKRFEKIKDSSLEINAVCLDKRFNLAPFCNP